jgi:hypothetical protein
MEDVRLAVKANYDKNKDKILERKARHYQFKTECKRLCAILL